MHSRSRKMTFYLIITALTLLFAADRPGFAADPSAPHGGLVTLSLNTIPRESIGDRKPGLEGHLLDIGAAGSRDDHGDGLDADTAANLRLLQTEPCSTGVVLATFFKSRYCMSGTLVVAASSSLGSAANLELVGYGPMIWDDTTRMWVARVRNLETNPGMVKVEGAGCSAQEEIMTVPYGCDARIGPDSQLTP
jgi:hypothetical protein